LEKFPVCRRCFSDHNCIFCLCDPPVHNLFNLSCFPLPRVGPSFSWLTFFFLFSARFPHRFRPCSVRYPKSSQAPTFLLSPSKVLPPLFLGSRFARFLFFLSVPPPRSTLLIFSLPPPPVSFRKISLFVFFDLFHLFLWPLGFSVIHRPALPAQFGPLSPVGLRLFTTASLFTLFFFLILRTYLPPFHLAFGPFIPLSSVKCTSSFFKLIPSAFPFWNSSL